MKFTPVLLPLISLIVHTTLDAYTLESTYNYKNPTILSVDLIPECPKKFELLKIPEGKTTYRLNAHILVKSYELHGCKIDTIRSPYVNFTKESDIDLPSLRRQLSDLFTLHYPTIHIDRIDIHPRGYIETLPNGAKAIFDQDTHTRSKGTFYVIDEHSVRRYFDFLLQATLPVMHSSEKISRHDVLSAANARMVSIPFTAFKSQPLITFPSEPYRLRIALRENSPILSRHIEPVPIVSKGGKVVAVIKNGAVEMEFSATATQEGSLNDIITIQKSDGKRAKAKIIGDNRVELQ